MALYNHTYFICGITDNEPLSIILISYIGAYSGGGQSGHGPNRFLGTTAPPPKPELKFSVLSSLYILILLRCIFHVVHR